MTEIIMGRDDQLGVEDSPGCGSRKGTEFDRDERDKQSRLWAINNAAQRIKKGMNEEETSKIITDVEGARPSRDDIRK